MYSDQQGRSEYVAIIDSDVALTTPVTADLIFNINQKDENGNVASYILTDTQFQKGFWDKGDYWMFRGDSNYWNFMITLPQVFPRALFPQYRGYVESIHNNQFETTDLWQHFRKTVKQGWMAMSQFCLLGNFMVRHWTDLPFDLRNETDKPTIRFGVHLPYYRGFDFGPEGKKDPESFQRTGFRFITDGLCELFCTNDNSGMRLEVCPNLCAEPLEQPRELYFQYVFDLYGTPTTRNEVFKAHFEPLRRDLALLLENMG
jgi:hypothetical protein